MVNEMLSCFGSRSRVILGQRDIGIGRASHDLVAHGFAGHDFIEKRLEASKGQLIDLFKWRTIRRRLHAGVEGSENFWRWLSERLVFIVREEDLIWIHEVSKMFDGPSSEVRRDFMD